MIDIQFAFQKTDYIDIYEHLKEVDTDFLPSLSKTVDLEFFAKKIFLKAVRFEGWYNKRLVGLLSAYFNNYTTNIGFINHVSVSNDFKRIGIANVLMSNCLKYASNNNFLKLKLEVATENQIARNFYEKFGFNIECENKNKVQMINNSVGTKL